MIEVEKIESGYGKIRILFNPSFSVPEGIVCGLFGPNGSGKTTLLRCLSGSHPYDSGSIRVKNKEINLMKNRELARFIAYVPQSHTPPFPFLVKEVVLMGRNPHISRFSGPCKPDMEHTWKILQLLHIQELADRPYTELSGGQRQLVILARALNQDTPVLLLDEPSSALDFRNQIILWKIIRQLAGSGKTIIACTHDPNHISWFCDQVVVLKGGTVLAIGKPTEVINSETLKELYGNLCTVGSCNDQQVIIPHDNMTVDMSS
jgi:iron complex transport system ATP-binding protein